MLVLKARSPEALLRNLPLYFTPQVNTIWNNLSDDHVAKKTMAAAQAFFKERFRTEYNTHAWHQWQSISKNDGGKESYMQWAARCKESYDRVSHMNPGQALPFQLLRDKVLGPCSD
jgi:hypothetical protein